jgi:ribonucleoside-triphosphate reductase
MYPFLNNGIKDLGGLSASPKNLDSYCGMYVNLIFAVAGQFAGAVATSEFLLYFDYFARKEWGDEYYLKSDVQVNTPHSSRFMSIKKKIHQHFQQVVYSINQPAAARGMQSAFVNFSYFDKPFFDAMFGNFVFPDMTKPKWESLQWLQKEFMMWFNKERLKCLITFPVESVALIYKDGKFVDEDTANFVAEEYARGHSFFTYISDTADSLSSCCRLKNKVDTKEFNFTNGNMGVETGSKSVITLNLNRIIQDSKVNKDSGLEFDDIYIPYLENILNRIYKYHIAYNECLWDMYEAGLLPVYKAGFISLNKQYLTIGINGLNQAAEFLGIKCRNNDEYKKFCQSIFETIKECNAKHNGKYFGHKVTFNTECVPAESLAVKNYNWDKKDG